MINKYINCIKHNIFTSYIYIKYKQCESNNNLTANSDIYI